MSMTRMNDRQNLRILVSETKKLLHRLDDVAATKLQHAERPVSCQRGCDACCHIPVFITKVEGLLIADYLHSRRDWKQWPERLAAASAPYLEADYNRHTYSRKAPPCVFLQDHECSVYQLRPAPCRYYYVHTPKEMCVATAETQEVCSPNLAELELTVSAFQRHAMHEFIVGPLPHMVFWCMAGIGWGCHREKAFEPWVNQLPTPEAWLTKALENGTDIDLSRAQHLEEAWDKLKAAGLPGTGDNL